MMETLDENTVEKFLKPAAEKSFKMQKCWIPELSVF